MSMIKCSECGKEISDKAINCPNCGAPNNHISQSQMNAQIQSNLLSQVPQSKNQTFNAKNQNQGKVKDSELSIVAAILALFTCTAWMGFIIAIIDLVTSSNNKIKKRHLGSYFAIVCSIVVLLMGITSFLNSENRNTDKNISMNQENNIDNSGIISTKDDQNLKNEIADVLIEPSEIYNENDVVISLKECNIDSGNMLVYFLIENNSSLNLGFNAHAYSINNIMTGNNIYDMDCDVAAGKKANAELKIKKGFLDKYNISTIKSLDILFWAYDNDKHFKEFDTGQITIKTNNYDETFNPISGKNIYDNNNIRVDYISNNGNEYTYCITNNTGDYFDFDVENITINDYSSSDSDYDLMSISCLNSCQAVFIIKANNDFMKLNDITNIQKVEFSLNIRPLGDYFSDWSTDMIVSDDF